MLCYYYLVFAGNRQNSVSVNRELGIEIYTEYKNKKKRERENIRLSSKNIVESIGNNRVCLGSNSCFISSLHFL